MSSLQNTFYIQPFQLPSPAGIRLHKYNKKTWAIVFFLTKMVYICLNRLKIIFFLFLILSNMVFLPTRFKNLFEKCHSKNLACIKNVILFHPLKSNRKLKHSNYSTGKNATIIWIIDKEQVNRSFLLKDFLPECFRTNLLFTKKPWTYWSE